MPLGQRRPFGTKETTGTKWGKPKKNGEYMGKCSDGVMFL
jgi:hypothetical protein